MTMQRDRHGRWMPTKGERTMNIQKAREERRSFYVGESKEHGTFSIASAEASTLHGEFFLSRRNAYEVSWKHLSAEEQTQFSKAIETEWQGVLDFMAVTIIHSSQEDVIREKHSERVILSPCRSMEGDRHRIQGQGQMVRARFFRILTSTRLSAVAQRQSCRPSTSHYRFWRRPRQEGRWPTGEKAFMQLYATPPPEGLPGEPEGALIRLNPEVYGLVSGMSGWRSRNVSQLVE